jgi:hypothetical protein
LFPENEAGEEKLRGGAAGKGPPTSDEVKKQTLDEHLDPSDAFPPAPSPITGLTHFNLEISETKQSSQMKELQSWTFWEAVIVPQLGDLGPRNGEYQCTGQRWRSTAPSPYKDVWSSFDRPIDAAVTINTMKSKLYRIYMWVGIAPAPQVHLISHI